MYSIVVALLRLGQRDKAVKFVRGLMLPYSYRQICAKLGTDPSEVRAQADQAAEQTVQIYEAMVDPDFVDPDGE